MIETIAINLLNFVLGTVFGSFLSVLVQRSLSGKKGIVSGRSSCPHCNHQLSALNLIPLFSWIFQKGRCSYCQKPISIIYPALELTTGLLFLTNFNFLLGQYNTTALFSLTLGWIFWVKLLYFNILILNLVAICFADLQKKAIPDFLLYSWIALSLINIAFNLQDTISIFNNPGLAIIVALIFFGGQYLLSRGRWLGSGDIYFSLGMGALLGLSRFTLAVVGAYLIGSTIIILLLILGQLKRKQTVPFTPFLILGTLLAFYYGPQIINWYSNLSFNVNII